MASVTWLVPPHWLSSGPSLSRGLSSFIKIDWTSLRGGRSLPRGRQKPSRLLRRKAMELAHYHSVTSYRPEDAVRGGETESTA